MALFDELRDRAVDAVQVAGKKVEEAYSGTKLKVIIADKQSEVRNLYRQLGQIVYENSKADEPDMEAVEDKIAEIDLVLDAVGELKRQERKSKKVVVCPACNAEVDENSNFCPVCGCEM